MHVCTARLARTRRRRGATMVESAVVLSVLLVVLFGLLDLGLGVLNCNNLKGVAQQVWRAAIVRGKDASGQLTVWGPTTYQGTAASTDEIGVQAGKMLVMMKGNQVNVRVDWLDGGNSDGNRVRVTVTYSHTLLAPSLFGMTSIPLKAVSTQPIVN